MKPASKPHIRRVRLKHTGRWVWGLFRSKDSLTPFAMAGAPLLLSAAWRRYETRRIS